MKFEIWCTSSLSISIKSIHVKYQWMFGFGTTTSTTSSNNNIICTMPHHLWNNVDTCRLYVETCIWQQYKSRKSSYRKNNTLVKIWGGGFLYLSKTINFKSYIPRMAYVVSQIVRIVRNENLFFAVLFFFTSKLLTYPFRQNANTKRGLALGIYIV